MAATIEKKPAGLKTQLELPKKGTNKVTMKGLVYEGPGKIELKDIPKPVIEKPTDALVKVIKTTICGTDLGILHGKTPPANPELVNTNTSPMLVKTVWSGKIETQK